MSEEEAWEKGVVKAYGEKVEYVKRELNKSGGYMAKERLHGALRGAELDFKRGEFFKADCELGEAIKRAVVL